MPTCKHLCPRERITFGRSIYGMNNLLEEKKEEFTRLNRHLNQALEIMLDREQIIKDLEKRILSLEKANAAIKEQARAGQRKDVQLREFY